MIKDSYSVPHFSKFDWSEVDWHNPLPNDIVALADKTRAVRGEYFSVVRDIISAGGTPDDVPSLVLWTWDYVVVPVGIASGEFNSDLYELFGDLVYAGEFVRDDRMYAGMTDDEMSEHFDMLEQVKKVSSALDISEAVQKVNAKRENAGKEIAMLKEMSGEI